MLDRWAETGMLLGLGLTIVLRSLTPESRRSLATLASKTGRGLVTFAGETASAYAARQKSDEMRRSALASLPSSSPLQLTGLRLDQIMSRFAPTVPDPSPASTRDEVPVPEPKPEETPSSSETLWQSVLGSEAVIVILGKRGSGKTALACWLAESCRYRIAPYFVGAPDTVHNLLPKWFGSVSSWEDIPLNALLIYDEAYSQFHARDSQAKASKRLSTLINQSRQRGQTLIFVTQEARQVDRNIVSSANVIIFKEPGPLQAEFERPELRRIAERARAGFDSIKGDRRPWSYVWAPDADFAGMVESPEPSFRSNRLSNAYASKSQTAEDHHPSKVTLAERRIRAKELKGRGWTYSEIARAIGVSKATAVNYVRDYPYRAD